MTIEEAIDEVGVAGPTTAGADGESTGEVGVGSSGEGGCFFVTGMDPID